MRLILAYTLAVASGIAATAATNQQQPRTSHSSLQKEHNKLQHWLQHNHDTIIESNNNRRELQATRPPIPGPDTTRPPIGGTPDEDEDTVIPTFSPTVMPSPTPTDKVTVASTTKVTDASTTAVTGAPTMPPVMSAATPFPTVTAADPVPETPPSDDTEDDDTDDEFNEDTPYCLLIQTSDAEVNDKADGAVTIKINTESGYEEITEEGKSYELGEVIIDKCYASEIKKIKISGPESNGWTGSVLFSTDGKDTYTPYTCVEGCTNVINFVTDPISVEADDNRYEEEMAYCGNGTTCLLKQMATASSTLPAAATVKCFGIDDGTIINNDGSPGGVLYKAVRAYVDQDCANNEECDIAQVYGWPMNSWCVGNVKDMAWLFEFLDMRTFNEDISGWDTSSVTNMYAMFRYATSFNGDVSNFDTSSVTSMGYMFEKAISFNQDLSNFDTSSVTDMDGMFAFAPSFNGDVSNFDISSVTSMWRMLYGATSFNKDLCSWQDSFPYTKADGIFANSNCTYQDTPDKTQNGPFCASDCQSSQVEIDDAPVAAATSPPVAAETPAPTVLATTASTTVNTAPPAASSNTGSYCVLVQTDVTEDEKANGKIVVSVDSGSGYVVVTEEDKKYDEGEVILDECYEMEPSIQINGSAENGWQGSFKLSTDGKATYAPFTCVEGCTGEVTVADPIAVEGDDGGRINEEIANCLNGMEEYGGNICTLRMVDGDDDGGDSAGAETCAERLCPDGMTADADYAPFAGDLMTCGEIMALFETIEGDSEMCEQTLNDAVADGVDNPCCPSGGDATTSEPEPVTPVPTPIPTASTPETEPPVVPETPPSEDTSTLMPTSGGTPTVGTNKTMSPTPAMSRPERETPAPIAPGEGELAEPPTATSMIPLTSPPTPTVSILNPVPTVPGDGWGGSAQHTWTSNDIETTIFSKSSKSKSNKTHSMSYDSSASRPSGKSSKSKSSKVSGKAGKGSKGGSYDGWNSLNSLYRAEDVSAAGLSSRSVSNIWSVVALGIVYLCFA